MYVLQAFLHLLPLKQLLLRKVAVEAFKTCLSRSLNSIHQIHLVQMLFHHAYFLNLGIKELTLN